MKVTIVKSVKLPSVVRETSGLFCTREGAITINDSGNEARLFFLNEKGEITKSEPLHFANKDIEAITANSEYFFIGDIGNNRGNREYVTVRQVDRTTYKKQQSYRLTYVDNNPSSNIPYDHDFDAEALTVRDDHLVLFSKSWDSEIANVYTVARSPKSQTLEAVASIKGLPGIITGADWDNQKQHFVVVGYNSNLLGVLRPFIATVSPDYTVTGLSPLERFGQVEGVCVAGNDEVWITQEKSPLQDARLVRLKLY